MNSLPDHEPGDVALARPRRFAALRDRWTSWYIGGATLGMMGDNIEHVITYWVMWEMFESPVLAGFAVVSHWLPHLLFSVTFGALADRHDCRRIVQTAQLLFIVASACWGVLILTGTLEAWMCCVLLVIHGMASSVWHPAEQVLLYDVAGRETITSAVRLNATGRNLGLLLGPLAGGVLLATLGPIVGIFMNTLFFLPMTILMIVLPFNGHTREGVYAKGRLTLRAAASTLTVLRGKPALISMFVLTAATSALVGATLGPVMPEFALMLGTGGVGLAYTMLLAASAVGAIIGGILLEATSWVRPTVRVAIVGTLFFALAIIGFAVSGVYALSLFVLVVAGAAGLMSSSTEQAVIQLSAPADRRGSVLGLYGMASMGLRAGSGVVMATLGSLIGIPLTLALSAGLLAIISIGVAAYVRIARVPRGEIN